MKAQFERALTAPGLYRFFVKVRLLTGRYFFLLLCVVGLVWYAFFTRQIIRQTKQDAMAVTQNYAELIKTAISERMNDNQIEVVFTQIIQKLNFPIVITDTAWNPITWKNIAAGPFFHRRTIAPTDTDAAGRLLVKQQIERLRQVYDPKEIRLGETGQTIGYLVYGNSDLVRTITWMPFVEVGLILTVILFAYLAFHSIRITERTNLWVGLAKETAHQLGTPISSLMGWVEYLQTAGDEDAETPPQETLRQVATICDNMRNDLTRLRKITGRFSQIGSVPSLALCDLNSVLEDVIRYFRMRLPLVGRRVKIHQLFGELPMVPANRDLIEWVFENLFKNSLDAINKPDGLIEIKTEFVEVDNLVRISHKDNGKGISWEGQKKIFSPGYTTKTRGWGLGLTLAKRIVEDYHRGHIYVSWSQKDKGTAFHIDLPVAT